MTRLTSFMISDILSETRRCHDDDVTDDVITGSRTAASQLMRTAAEDTTSAAGNMLYTLSGHPAVTLSPSKV